MASKRAPGGAPSSSPPPIVVALLLVGAIGWSIGQLVRQGMVTWPPTHLLACLATLAGALALVGPFILSRAGRSGGGGLGELLWLTGGLLIWIFNIVGVAGGRLKTLNWATPLGERTMGLIILAVLLAGLRAGLAGRDWSWTNVTGWALGLFWVGLALATWLLTPDSGLGSGLVLR